MPQPLLDISDVGIVGEGIGRGRGAQRMYTQTWCYIKQTYFTGIVPDNVLINGRRVQGFGQGLRTVVLDRAEEGAFEVLDVPCVLPCFFPGFLQLHEIRVNQSLRQGVQGQIVYLVALARRECTPWALGTGTHRWTSARPRQRWGGGTHALGLRAPAGMGSTSPL